MLHLSQIHLSITINEGKYILSQYFTLLIYIVLACSHLLMFLKIDTLMETVREKNSFSILSNPISYVWQCSTLALSEYLLIP